MLRAQRNGARSWVFRFRRDGKPRRVTLGKPSTVKANKSYLNSAMAKGIADRYICRHRAMWYTQERRPPALFVCTYLGRSDKKSVRPFRFILNNSKATAANVYLMLYPREPFERALLDSPELKRRVWEST